MRLKLIPLLLYCLCGPLQAAGLGPLRVSSELLRSGGDEEERAVDTAPRSVTDTAETPGEDSASAVRERVEDSPAVTQDKTSELPQAEEPRQTQNGAASSARKQETDPSEVLPESGASRAAETPESRVPRADGPALATGLASSGEETEVFAERVTGLRSVEMIGVGNAELRRGDVTLYADRMRYNELSDEVYAEGNVRLERGSDWMTGDWARFIVYQHVGELAAPEYSFTREVRRSDEPVEDETLPEEARRSNAEVVGRGGAETMLFEGENQYRLVEATWTTCKPENPDWYIKAADLKLDYDREVGTARGSSLVFKDVPLLWWPRMSFPLAQQRQSGFLTPSVGVSNQTGLDMTIPYYWNIAPNYDATLVGRYMGRRGLLLGGEYRYLSHDYNGEARAEVLPSDREYGSSRALGSWQHEQRITPRLRARLDLNAVSDDDYFEDLSTTLAVASRRNLLRDARLNYSGGWWRAGMRLQSYQTLEGATPYRRLPQLTLNARRADLPLGATVEFDSEFVSFRNPESNRVNGQRLHMYPKLSLPHVRPGYYITPKVGLHYTRYDLAEKVRDGRPVTGGGTDAISRTLPIVTVDSGMFFDRDTRLFGNEFQQTLEPRLYYVRIPYENQDDIPRFDTGRYGFGFAQIFSENRFSGIDRVGDANHVTVAVTSRLIEPESGLERLRGTLGQRFHLEDRRVRLRPGDERETRGRTDVLGELSGRLTDSISVESGFQYDVQDSEAQRWALSMRYNPEHGRVFNVGYRYAREGEVREDELRDVDLSVQWPLGERWYGIGRITRSVADDRITEAIAGFEYVSECTCWAFRAAAQRFALSEDRTSNALFFQLELSGLGGLGPSPVDMLKRSVPGYGRITDVHTGRYFGE